MSTPNAAHITDPGLQAAFTELLDEMATAGRRHANAHTGAGGGWDIPRALVGDPAAPNVPDQVFDRTAMNDAYLQSLADPNGRTNETASLKRQIDYAAAMERSFRCRHMTLCRAFAAAAARRAGHVAQLSNGVQRDISDIAGGLV